MEERPLDFATEYLRVPYIHPSSNSSVDEKVPYSELLSILNPIQKSHSKVSECSDG